jgi:hypothetical protein
MFFAGLTGRPYEIVWGCSSAGEHFVDIEGVTGSIPVTPTISYKRFLKQSVSFGDGAPHHKIRWRAFEGILTGMQDGIATSNRQHLDRGLFRPPEW